jgi:hypothetical protein
MACDSDMQNGPGRLRGLSGPFVVKVRASTLAEAAQRRYFAVIVQSPSDLICTKPGVSWTVPL